MNENLSEEEKRLNKCLKGLLRSFRPPQSLTVSQWADKYRILSKEGSAESGRWRTSKTPYLKEIMDAFTDPNIERIVMVSSSQIGKALFVNTPILTSTGWKTMEELQVGDMVFDENGKPCKITHVTEVMYGHECYKVIFSDGSHLIADADHQWKVDSSTSFSSILTTKQMAQDFGWLNTDSSYRYSIPISKGLKDLLIKSDIIPEADNRKIIDIYRVDSVPVKCIQVDSESHLYLAGKTMIPTHNSEMELNAIGYIIHQDPGPILYIHPDLEAAEKFSTQRLAPMVRDMKVLRGKVRNAKRGDSRDTKLQKSFPGGLITLTGTHSPAALASAPIRYVICDERDRWKRSTGKEGDPFKLAEARQTTFYNRKTIEVSTPTIKGNSPIVESYELGTQERWNTKCPHCGEYFEVIFKRLHYTKHEVEVSGKAMTFVDDKVEVECPHCGCLSTEKQIRKQPHKWIANAPQAKAKKIRSFWLNTFSSPWVSWSAIIQKYEDAQGNPEALKTVYNTCFGELWEELGATHGEEYYYERRESYGSLPDGTPIDVPEGPVFLTMGVDVQDNRLEYEVVGFGHHKETWGIRKGMIDGSPADSTTWRKLDDVLQHDWIRFNGQRMRISSTCIDSGGHYTTSVYEYCRSHLTFHVFAIKGFGGDGVPFISPFSRVHIGETNKLCRLYKIGVDSGKAAIMTNLCVEDQGPGFCHFPSEEDKGYNLRYFTGLLSERIEENEKTGKRRWVKIPGHERNEPLDCRNYALAAFDLAHCDTFAAEKRLNELVTEPKPVRNKPKSSPKPRLKRKEFDLYGDF